jgi:hypothetical protein
MVAQILLWGSLDGGRKKDGGCGCNVAPNVYLISRAFGMVTPTLSLPKLITPKRLTSKLPGLEGVNETVSPMLQPVGTPGA